MSEAEIKLKLIRLIDSQEGSILRELYDLILTKVSPERNKKNTISTIEEGYKAMSEDIDREEEAFEWIEGTLNSEEI